MLIRLFFLWLITLHNLTTAAQTALYPMPPWQQLRSELSSASVIGLGEVGHGYESINAAKGTVLTFLRQQTGVKAVVFESSFTLCALGYLRGDSLEPRLTSSLYPFWNTASVQGALRPFGEAEKEDNTPLIQGCDVQEDCRFVRLTEYLTTQGLITASVSHLQAADSILSFYIGKDFSRRGALGAEESRSLTTRYEAVATELRSRSLPEVKQKLLLRCLENRKWLCRYLTLSSARDRMHYRDSLMAENVVWLKNELYAKDKIALWAANTHIAGKKKESGPPQWMGERLTEYYKGAYFPISFQKGSVADAKSLDHQLWVRYISGADKFKATILLNTVEKINPKQWVTPCE